MPRSRPGTPASLQADARSALDWLKRHSSTATLAGMARYNIPSDNALGVTMANLKVLARRLGRNHDLAAAVWATGWYETRMLAALIDEPERVTAAQMDRWARDFDNWAICDTACFALFDRTPHAWAKVAQWSRRREEFIKRAAFATLWGLTVHDKAAADQRFTHGLSLIEREASDDRNFIKKAVSMALRAIGKRKPSLRVAALAVARRLADSPDAAARWVGKDALRDLNRR